MSTYNILRPLLTIHRQRSAPNIANNILLFLLMINCNYYLQYTAITTYNIQQAVSKQHYTDQWQTQLYVCHLTLSMLWWKYDLRCSQEWWMIRVSSCRTIGTYSSCRIQGWEFQCLCWYRYYCCWHLPVSSQLALDMGQCAASESSSLGTSRRKYHHRYLYLRRTGFPENDTAKNEFDILHT